MSKASQFIRLMFESRQVAHKAHFTTGIDSKHRALGEFYEAIVDLADRFTEVYIAKYGMPESLDFSCDGDEGADIAETLRNHLNWIETNRNLIVQSGYTPIQSIIDDIVEQYLHTLFKLERLL